MKQPALGITASLIIIAISLVIIWLMGVDVFMGWGSFLPMCAVPYALMVGGFWHSEEPRAIGRMPQPAKGFVYLGIGAVVAIVVALIHWQVRGGGQSPPPPMSVMSIIGAVITSFFLVIVLGGWPFSLIKNKTVAGIALLLGIFVLNAVIWQIFYNFAFAQGAPFYRPELDPGGIFGAWPVTVVGVGGVCIMFMFLHLDLWPFVKSPALRKQPALGVVWLIVCMVLGWVLYWLGTAVAGIPGPTFMIRGMIPYIFGTIIVLNMLRASIFGNMTQPVRGIVSNIVALVLGLLLAQIYGALMPILSAPLPSGPENDFAAEMWLANALLAITFPLLSFYGDFFGLWPLAGRPSTIDPVTESAASDEPIAETPAQG